MYESDTCAYDDADLENVGPRLKWKATRTGNYRAAVDCCNKRQNRQVSGDLRPRAPEVKNQVSMNARRGYSSLFHKISLESCFGPCPITIAQLMLQRPLVWPP